MAEGTLEVGVMTSASQKGIYLFALLKKELGLPEHTRSMTVSFELDSPVTVTCVYYPAEVRREDHG